MFSARMARTRGGGGVGPETPLALGVDYWWDARRTDLVGLSAGNVASWACSITGSVFSEAAPNQPKWNAIDASFAGKPCLEFDATNTERLVWNDGDQLGFLHDGSGGTCIIVDDNSSTGGMFSNGGTTSAAASAGLLFPNKGATTQGCVVSNASGVYVANFNAAYAQIPEVAGYRFKLGESPEVEISFQGVSAGVAAVGVPIGSSAFNCAMGRQGNSAYYVTGKLCQVLLWRRYLPTSQLNAVFNWARSEFGVT